LSSSLQENSGAKTKYFINSSINPSGNWIYLFDFNWSMNENFPNTEEWFIWRFIY
jgi:hypothetical protein